MKRALLGLMLCLLSMPAFAFGDGGLEGPMGPVAMPIAPQPVTICHPIFVPGSGWSFVCQ